MKELRAIEGKCVKCHRVWNLSLVNERDDYTPGKCPICKGKLYLIGYEEVDTEEVSKYRIRRYVLNITGEMWLALDKKYPDDPFLTTPSEFLDAIGLPGEKSACYNQEERIFFDEIYDLWRKR